MSNNTRELIKVLAKIEQPEEILRLFFRLCSESELQELGLRFYAYTLVQKRLKPDEILRHFPGRGDIVARVLMHERMYFGK